MQIRRPDLAVTTSPPVPRLVTRGRGYPFSPPGPTEIEALGRVSAYLRRAGNEVESRSLSPAFGSPSGCPGGTGPPEADLRALRESLRAAAALCEGMAEITDASGATTQSRQGAYATWKREATG